MYPLSSTPLKTSRRWNKAMSIFPRSLLIIGVVFMFLVGCGEEEEEQHPHPRELIDGTWTGSLISETTGRERFFEAILSYGNPDILPPYYYDLIGFRTSSKITNVNYTPVGVHGVFKIRSDDRVDTLAVGGSFNSGSGLYLRLYRANGSRIYYYWLTNGMISDDMVEGAYEEFGLKNGDQVDAGTWSGIRAVEQKS